MYILTNSRRAAEGNGQEEQLRATALLEVERLRQVLREKEHELQELQQAAATAATAATEVERLKQVLRENEHELQGLRRALSERGGGGGVTLCGAGRGCGGGGRVCAGDSQGVPGLGACAATGGATTATGMYRDARTRVKRDILIRLHVMGP